MASNSGILVIFSLVIGLTHCQNPGQKTVSAAAAVSVRDPNKYPVCVSDSDCDHISEKVNKFYYIPRNLK